MQRRKFIHLAGGGVVVAAAASATTAHANGWFSAAYPSEALEAWRGPSAALSDPRMTALAYAITAPNPHNLQPWIADLREPGVITVRTDPKRVLPETDPFGRQITIGHGAFLELLVMALGAQGLDADLTLWPQGELPGELKAWDDRPVARLALKRSTSPQQDALFAQVLKRHSAKTLFDISRTVSPDTMATLAAAARTPLQLGSTAQAERVAALRQVCMDAAAVEMNTEATMMESMRLMRVGPKEILQHRDGISLNSPMLRLLDTVGLMGRDQFPKPGSSTNKGALSRYESFTSTAMAFAWIAGPNTRSAQIAAGRAHVRMHLQATAIGLDLHPLSQALQEFTLMQPAYVKTQDLLLSPEAKAQGHVVHMLNRLGYSTQPVSATPRRPLNAFTRTA